MPKSLEWHMKHLGSPRRKLEEQKKWQAIVQEEKARRDKQKRLDDIKKIKRKKAKKARKKR